MQKKDWIAVGIKLLGVYYAAMAVIGLGGVVLGLVMNVIYRPDIPAGMTKPQYMTMFLLGVIRWLLNNLIAPVVQGFAAWLLLKKTDWCLKKAGVECEPPQM
jgi:hypothetical protein